MMIPNTKLTLGKATTVADGTWFAVAVWNGRARDYVEDPALGLYSDDTLAPSYAQFQAATTPVGRRAIRYTVHHGVVTTRRALS